MDFELHSSSPSNKDLMSSSQSTPSPIVHHMLQNMNYQGKGLGLHEQCILEPVHVRVPPYSYGFGYTPQGKQSKDVGNSSMHPKSTFHHKSHHIPKSYVAIPHPSSYKYQKHVTIHLPPSTLPPLLPTPNIPPSTFPSLLPTPNILLIHPSINLLKILIMTNQCTHCLNMKLPLIPPYPWDSKEKIWMPLPIKRNIIRILMPSDIKEKNQIKIHLKGYINPYFQKKRPKIKWFGSLRKRKASQMRHPHLKNANHPLPPHIPTPFKNLIFHPIRKIKVMKILSLCGYLKHFVTHLLRKHLHCFLHHHLIKSFNIYHSVCKYWSWFPSIPHFHIPPFPHLSSIILHISPTILSLWSMLLDKALIHL